MRNNLYNKYVEEDIKLTNLKVENDRLENCNYPQDQLESMRALEDKTKLKLQKIERIILGIGKWEDFEEEDQSVLEILEKEIEDKEIEELVFQGSGSPNECELVERIKLIVEKYPPEEEINKIFPPSWKKYMIE